MIDDLLNTELFKDLAYEVLEDIADFCTPINLVEGDALISENDSDYDLYILIEGKLEVVSNSSAGTSNEVVISEQDYSLFGEITWMTHRRRTATLRCQGSVSAMRINGDALMAYLETNTEVGFEVMRNIAKIIATRLENTNTTIKQILFNTNL